MSSSAVQQRYLSYAELAKRWTTTKKTAAAKIRRHRPTAILKLSPTLHRVALRDVLAIERELRGCGSLDLEGL